MLHWFEQDRHFLSWRYLPLTQPGWQLVPTKSQPSLQVWHELVSPPVQVPHASLHWVHTPCLLNIPSPQEATQTPDFKAEVSRQRRQVVPSLQSAQSVMHAWQVPLALYFPLGQPSKHDEPLSTLEAAQVWHELLSPPVQEVQAESHTSHLPEFSLANLLAGQF